MHSRTTVPSGSFFWRLTPLAVAVLAMVPFLPALNGEFLSWDDTVLIVENPHIRALGTAQLAWMFSSFHLGPYQPLPWLSYALDYQLWGLNPRGFHLTAILLHGLNAASVSVLARRLISLAVPQANLWNELLAASSAAAALAFAIHPLRVESVVWISERRDVLCLMFGVWATVAYLWAVERRAAGSPRLMWFTFSLVLFLAALSSKAVIMGLPFVLLVLDVYPLDRLRNSGQERHRLSWLLVEKTPFLILAAGAAVLAFYGQATAGGINPISEVGIDDRLAVASYGTVFYLIKTLVPIGLSPLYELPDELSLWSPKFLTAAAAVLTICAVAFLYRRRFPSLFAGWVCYLLLVAPVSGLMQAGHHMAADRYTYLATLPFAITLGGWIFAYATTSSRPLGLPFAAILLACFVLGPLTWLQSRHWRSTETLWARAFDVDPHSIHASNNLGRAMIESGKVAEAAAHFHSAVEARPNDAVAHNNFAIALGRLGRLAEAVRHYRRAIELEPEMTEPAYNIGLVLSADQLLKELGHESLDKQWDAAAGWFAQVIKCEPTHRGALNGLGIVSRRLGRLEDAIGYYRRALAAHPGDVELRYNLALALAETDSPDEAIVEYRMVLAARPDFAPAAANLALLLTELGHFEQATATLVEALRHQPGHAPLSAQLSWLLATAPDDAVRDGPRAVRLAEQLAQAAPNNLRVLDVLAAALAEIGDFDRAVAAASQAIELATPPNERLQQPIRDRLELYRQRKPFRLASPSSR